MSERKLLDLLEKEEIRTLRLNYSQLLDSGQIHKMEEVFTSDARVEVTVGEMNGIEQIKQGLKIDGQWRISHSKLDVVWPANSGVQ